MEKASITRVDTNTWATTVLRITSVYSISTTNWGA